MIGQMLGDDIAIINSYEEEFGPLPSTFMMESKLVNSLPRLCRGALSKGRALTLADLGVKPIPDGAVI
tara:strand:- start:301 stop:504 length:204 start_codon:yes stop_codon:yes gene_type:complete